MKAITLGLLCCLLWPGWASATAVHLQGVPTTAVTALRAAMPNLQPVDDGAELQLIWQAQHYQQLKASLTTPAIVLLAYPGQVKLRPQDMALYWAPTLAEQFQLAKELNPGIKRVGVVLTPATQPLLHDLKRHAIGLMIEPLLIDGDINTRQLAQFMQSVDVLLAAPDDQLFSPANTKLLLLPSYRLQRPWVGPSAAFVQAGAVATRQVSRQHLIQAIRSAIEHWQQKQTLPASRALVADEVVVNAPVLRSMGLRQPKERP
jgi:hypothetical protein